MLQKQAHRFSDGKNSNFLVSLPISIFDCSLLVYNIFFISILYLPTLINSLISSFLFLDSIGFFYMDDNVICQ